MMMLPLVRKSLTKFSIAENRPKSPVTNNENSGQSNVNSPGSSHRAYPINSNNNEVAIDIDRPGPSTAAITVDNGNDSDNDCEDDQNSVDDDTKVVGKIEVMVGTIRNLDDKFGIINGLYKFDPAKFGNGFKLGDKVRFAAEDRYREGWIVTAMSHFVSEAKLKSQENKKFSTYVVTVISTDDESGTILVNCPNCDNISIPKSDLPQDYEIKTGDFLEIKIEALDELPFFDSNDTTKNKIISVLPTKIKAIVNGEVTKDMFDHIVIDDHILITKEFLTDPTFPKVGDMVDASAVESTQENQRFNWRVIKISKSEFDQYTEENAETREERDTLSESMLEFVKELQADKFGVEIYPSPHITFNSLKLGSVLEKTITIINKSARIHVLRNVEILHDQGTCKFEVKVSSKESSDIGNVLLPNAAAEVKIKCTALLMGRTKELCIFEFQDFKIGRYILAKGIPTDCDMISELTVNKGGPYKETKPWMSKKELEEFCARERVRGIPAIRRPFFLPKNLPASFHPQCVYEALSQNDAKLLFEKFPTLVVKDENENLELTFGRYKDMFQVGLWFEELENQVLREKNTQHSVILYPTSGDGMYFDVPSLPDFQPALILGEKMRAFDPTVSHGKVYEAYVTRISDCRVYGRFDLRFQNEYKGRPMTVKFTLGRSSYQRGHYAVENAPLYLGENWLFPKNIEVKPPRFTFLENEDDDSDEDKTMVTSTKAVASCVLVRKRPEQSRPSKKSQTLDARGVNLFPLTRDLKAPEVENEVPVEVKLKWFKDNLNEEQKNTVRRILRGQCRSVPYIIFGPPGTGKTVTVVEAVMQVHKLDKNSRILVTAPSNAAADLIAEYLVASGQFNKGDFVRFNGYQRDKSTISDTIKDYCLDGDHLQNIARNRIIVSTCNNTGQFIRLGITAGHFTHVFLDEAGYCYEPDAIIPALFVSLDRKGQYIMAGDPNQLGPSLTSSAAERYGLEISFLERLMKLPLYQRDRKTKEYNPLVLTKLLRNYRSHKLILNLPSKLMYDNELIPAASRDETETLSYNLDFLPKQGIPLMFHGVRGDEAKDADSPSWYNPLEVVEVIEYVKKLMRNGCTADDIGIITPYRKQVEKIRKGIEKDLKCQMPKVGSINEFQGGERNVIILSLVRSRDIESQSVIEANRFDFLFSPKRFNVSVTRARSMLIVIGNPHLFANNETWSKFIRYCLWLEAYVGCDLPLMFNTEFQKNLFEPSKAEIDKPYVRPIYPVDSDDEDECSSDDSQD